MGYRDAFQLLHTYNLVMEVQTFPVPKHSCYCAQLAD
jgi:hypothetical protein